MISLSNWLTFPTEWRLIFGEYSHYCMKWNIFYFIFSNQLRSLSEWCAGLKCDYNFMNAKTTECCADFKFGSVLCVFVVHWIRSLLLPFDFILFFIRHSNQKIGDRWYYGQIWTFGAFEMWMNIVRVTNSVAQINNHLPKVSIYAHLLINTRKYKRVFRCMHFICMGPGRNCVGFCSNWIAFASTSKTIENPYAINAKCWNEWNRDRENSCYCSMLTTIFQQ